ncbi:MAG: hypothetical protein HY898_31745 [Deltaproteobacteria bacterium]|nr:hypothetical protein [Deltaproteobacteria bacterium]
MSNGFGPGQGSPGGNAKGSPGPDDAKPRSDLAEWYREMTGREPQAQRDDLPSSAPPIPAPEEAAPDSVPVTPTPPRPAVVLPPDAPPIPGPEAFARLAPKVPSVPPPPDPGLPPPPYVPRKGMSNPPPRIPSKPPPAPDLPRMPLDSDMSLAQELSAKLPPPPQFANAPTSLPAVTAPEVITDDNEVTPSPFKPHGFPPPPAVVDDLPRMPMDSDMALAHQLDASLPPAPQIENLPPPPAAPNLPPPPAAPNLPPPPAAANLPPPPAVANLPPPPAVANLPPPPEVANLPPPPAVAVAAPAELAPAAIEVVVAQPEPEPPPRSTRNSDAAPISGSLERPSTREAARAWRQPGQGEQVRVVDSTMVEVEHALAPPVVLAATPAMKVVVDGRAPSRMDPTMRLQAITVRKTGPTAFVIIVGALVVIVGVVVLRAVLIGRDTVTATARPVVTSNVNALRSVSPAASEAEAPAPASATASAQADAAPSAAPARPVDVSALPTASARTPLPGSTDASKPPTPGPGAAKPPATGKAAGTTPAGTSTGSKVPDFGGRE